MKNATIMAVITLAGWGLLQCAGPRQQQPEIDWVVDRFDDIKVLRYQVDGFETLPLEQKKLIYYLSQAALCGRDIIFDQNCRYNLAVRRTLEAIYENYKGDRTDPQWAQFEKYLKKVWFANGVHHHYSGDKFTPGFTAEYFDQLLAAIPAEQLPADLDQILSAQVRKVIFDSSYLPKRVNQSEGVDMLRASAMNYYQGVSQAEATAFYKKMAEEANDPTPVSYGLNSKLVKENGQLREKTWKIGGMYSPAIEKIVYWLEKAAQVASTDQARTISMLIDYYTTGNLRSFDIYNIDWLGDTLSSVDFVNGFIETYGDPLGYKASWESMVNFKNIEATRRTEIISQNAQWFEDLSPVDPRFRKPEVKGVSAKVITAAMLGGDCYPATPIGINLPNADWIRRDYGSKSVTVENITYAYDQAGKGNGFREEFVLRKEDRERLDKYSAMASDLHTDLHECLGHGSGQLAPGVVGDELSNYHSTLEETRADLFALYYIADPRMVELGLLPSLDAAWAEYASFVMNGLMTQLARIQPGKEVEEAHMRNRKLIAEWCYEKGRDQKVIEKVVKDGKTYVVVNDFEALRGLFADLLREVQRIKSEGDYKAGKALVEAYAVKVDQPLHQEVLRRYKALNIEPYSGFVNPVYRPVMQQGQITDITIEYPGDYTGQMLEYSKEYSYLPTTN